MNQLEHRRIAISGASGLIGSELRASLSSRGHRVQTLVRRTPDASGDEIAWDPQAGTIDDAPLQGADALIHLSGESLAGRRWTDARKLRFRASRVGSTRLLAQTLGRMDRPPRVLVVASAIGFYGNRGDEPLDERAARGTGFLPELCEAWEAASEPAEQAGIRVVRLRIGLVLSVRGGALQKLLTPFRLGLGGRIGSGRQYMSWIGLDDLISIIHEAIFNDGLAGAVNAVAPRAVTNAEFVRTLGRVLRRPALLPLPAPIVRALFGEMGQSLLLDGANVLPARLEQLRFTYQHPTLESALRAELERREALTGLGRPSGLPEA